ncbi:MAG: flagellar motor switch protein FliG [Mangrovicoccus sp.]
MSQLPSLASTGAPALPATKPPQLTKRRKAAIIVRILLNSGVELDLTDLPEAMQIDLTHEMGSLRQIDRATLESVVEEFIGDLENVGATFPGGLVGALNALDGKISPATANRIRKQAGVPQYADPWGYLAGVDTSKLLELIEQESNEIAAVVMSKLPVGKAAELLGLLPGDKARRITYAVSMTGTIDPKTVDTIGSALVGQLDGQPSSAFSDGPVARVGAILNSSPAATREDVLGGLEEDDKEFADEVRKAIFTFSNIADRIDVRDIPKVTRAVDQGILVTALAGATGNDAKSVDFILNNMSQRMAQQLRDEMQDAGKIKAKDAEEAMGTVVAAIREMEAAGELILLSDEDDEE